MVDGTLLSHMQGDQPASVSWLLLFLKPSLYIVLTIRDRKKKKALHARTRARAATVAAEGVIPTHCACVLCGGASFSLVNVCAQSVQEVPADRLGKY